MGSRMTEQAAPELGEGAEAVLRWSLERCRAELAHADKWVVALEDNLVTARALHDEATNAVRELERLLEPASPEAKREAMASLEADFAVREIVWEPPPEPHPLAPKLVAKPTGSTIADLKPAPITRGFTRRVLSEVAAHVSLAQGIELQWRHKVLAARVIRTMDPARSPGEVSGALGITPSSTAPSQLALAGWTDADVAAVIERMGGAILRPKTPEAPAQTAPEPGENEPLSDRKLAKARDLIAAGRTITAAAGELNVSKKALYAALHPVVVQ